jgi:peptidoglycan/xylan/chitin deacetylase (PgdA/CDA1 family)
MSQPAQAARVRRIVSQALWSAARAAGLFSLSANSRRRRERLLILCYHGIALDDEEQWMGHLYMSRARFERRLELLRSLGANVLPLGEAVERLQKRSLPPRSVAITFDDGFVDFHVHALPLLRKFGCPSTVYLTTHYCRHRLPIFNLVTNYLLWRSGRTSLELDAFGCNGTAPIANYEQRQAVVASLVRWADTRGLATEAKDGIARSLARILGVDYDAILGARILQLMTPEEVAGAARSGVDVELHTHRHRTPRDSDLFIKEIRDNAACIREFTGREPSHFCYPSGDYDRGFFPWLKQLGVRTATTCESGLAAPRSEPFLLPRMLDDSVATELDFERWLSGFGT